MTFAEFCVQTSYVGKETVVRAQARGQAGLARMKFEKST